MARILGMIAIICKILNSQSSTAERNHLSDIIVTGAGKPRFLRHIYTVALLVRQNISKSS